MLQEKLKNATNINHDQLESLMYVEEIMNKTLSFKQYKSLLVTNYLVHKQYENVVHKMLPDSLRLKLNVEKRSKLSALEKDLLEIGLNTFQLEHQFNKLPVLDFNESSVLGAMYVLEGATMGGNVIYKKLKLNPNFNTQEYQFHYYNIYKDLLIPNWMLFVKSINETRETDEEEAINGAVTMFDAIAEISKQVKFSDVA
jgi:heme oxygenase